jgi:hypothetical protein
VIDINGREEYNTDKFQTLIYMAWVLKKMDFGVIRMAKRLQTLLEETQDILLGQKA